MSLPPALPHVELDDRGHLAEDLSCVRCGYNLRGLDPEKTCPECGLAVGRSMRGDLLRYADPDWVERLALGLGLAMAALIVGILCMIWLALLMLGSKDAASLSVGLVGLPTLIGLAACWLFTTPEPRNLESEPILCARNVARMAALLLTVLLLGEVMMVAARVPGWELLILLGILTATVGVYAAGSHARQLALRLPDPSLARETRIVGVGCTLIGASVLFGTVSSVLLDVLMLIDLGTLGDLLVLLLVVGFMITCAAFLMFGIWTLILIVLFNDLLRQASQHARSTWAADNRGDRS